MLLFYYFKIRAYLFNGKRLRLCKVTALPWIPLEKGGRGKDVLNVIKKNVLSFPQLNKMLAVTVSVRACEKVWWETQEAEKKTVWLLCVWKLDISLQVSKVWELWVRLPCCCEYLPSSGPPTASQAGSDPAAGCSEVGEHSGPTDTYKQG